MANYSVDTLAVDLVVTAEKGIEKFKEFMGIIDKTDKKLDGVSKSVSKVSKETDKMGTSSGMNKMRREVNELEKSVKKLEDSTKKASGGFAKMLKTGLKLAAIKKGIDFASGAVGASADYVGNLNMFNAAMGDMTDSANEFQKSFSSIFSINVSESTKMQGYFQSLFTSLKIGSEESALMSENVTKLSYDLAALYNLDPSQAFSKLQSGLIGQTKPLRQLGIDVTEQTLQTYLYEMGINSLVRELTQAEKTVLRQIAIMDQASTAQGFMAKTMDSPIQQIRIFKDQLQELYVWLGNVFINMFGAILPYINGFIMAVKEMVKAIAMLFGFKGGTKIKQQIGGIGDSVDDIGAGFGGVGKGIDKAKKKLKEFKGMLFGFDEINNIQTPTEPEAPSGGGGGGGGVGGLGGAYYDDLIDALSKYDNLMGSVKNKANDIRNKILDWLGFTYDLNELTGEISNLKWGGWSEMDKTLQNILITAGLIIGFIAAYKVIDWLMRVSGFIASLGGVVETLSFVFALAGEVIGKAFAAVNLPAAVMAGILVAVGAAVIDLWNTNEEFRENFNEAWNNIKETFSSIYDNYLDPIISALVEAFKGIWDDGLKPLWDDWKEFIFGIGMAMMDWWNAISPIVNKVLDIFGVLARFVTGVVAGAFTTMVNIVLGSLGTFFRTIGQIVDGIRKIFGGLGEFLAGVFTLDWNRAVGGLSQVVEGIAKTIKGILGGIANSFITVINAIMSGMNVAIRSMNKIKVPDWVPVIGGGGVNLQEFNMIPKFATGGFPEDGLFHANSTELVGGFSNGKTAVVNNHQIIEGVSQGVGRAVDDSFAKLFGNSSGSSKQRLSLYPSARHYAEATLDAIDMLYEQTGRRPKWA